jgi:hypothetical protein
MQNETVLNFSYSAICGRKKQKQKKTQQKAHTQKLKINKPNTKKQKKKRRETEFFIILLFIKQLRTYKSFISLTGNSNSTYHIC